jgi:hypothetical protein
MTGGVVISWGTAIPGREQRSLEVFTKALGYFEQLAKQGRIHGHKEYIAVTGNTGRASGFMLIEGQLDELLKIQIEPQVRKLVTEGTLICNNFSVQIFAGGSDNAMQHEISTYVEAAQELGYFGV